MMIFIFIMGKICCVCKKTKNYEEFHKNKSKKDGHQDVCRTCRKLKSEEKKQKRQEYAKNWYSKNSEKIKENSKNRYNLKKKVINHEKREKYKKDEKYRLKIKEQHKKYYNNNKDCVNQRNKIWVENNKEKKSEITKRHYHKYKTLMICRRLVKRTIKYLGTEKQNTTIDILGYTPNELKHCIETKFLEGMSWDNYGEWHIDHIKPISSFDKDESPSVINSLSNLQPLWAIDNLKKGNRF